MTRKPHRLPSGLIEGSPEAEADERARVRAKLRGATVDQAALRAAGRLASPPPPAGVQRALRRAGITLTGGTR